MSFNTILTPADLLVTESTPVGWYQAEIVSYDEAITKGTADKPSDGSMNAILEFKVLTGPTAGRTMKRYFNEKPKALAFGKNLWNALFGDEWKKSGLNSDMLKSSVGRKLEVYVKKDGAGRYDTIEDYRAIRKG